MRTLAKRVALAIAFVLILPALASYWLRSLVMGPDRALEGSSQALGLIPGVFGQYLRRAFLGRVLARCHSSATVEFGTLFSTVGARIDENVYVGPRCHLGLVHLERDVLVGAGVHIPSGRHIHGDAETIGAFHHQPLDRRVVRVGAGAWIGSAAVVMADVGEGTIVGAGAVVTTALPPRVVAAGVPARVLRARDAPPPA